MKPARSVTRHSTIGRRAMLAGVLAGAAAPPPTPAPPADAGADAAADAARADWQAFRDRFVKDGRVIDTGNGGITHTEGQGWGLLFAAHFNDRALFDRLLRWTTETLRRPHDALHAWRYDPAAAKPVSDMNNATDGDLFIAWALANAARRWGAPGYAKAAAAIGRDVLRLLTVPVGGKPVLLPAIEGFQKPGVLILNPSYYVFPAFAAVAPLVPSGTWEALRQDGAALIAQGCFGQWKLPPDWLQITRQDGALAPAPGWPPRCSYDAIRVPLYMAWAGLTSPVIAAFAAFYALREGKPPPAWVDLKSGAEAPYPAPSGMLAVAQIAAAVTASSTAPIDFPRVADAPDYYSAALILLARVAWQMHGTP